MKPESSKGKKVINKSIDNNNNNSNSEPKCKQNGKRGKKSCFKKTNQSNVDHIGRGKPITPQSKQIIVNLSKYFNKQFSEKWKSFSQSDITYEIFQATRVSENTVRKILKDYRDQQELQQKKDNECVEIVYEGIQQSKDVTVVEVEDVEPSHTLLPINSQISIVVTDQGFSDEHVIDVNKSIGDQQDCQEMSGEVIQ